MTPRAATLPLVMTLLGCAQSATSTAVEGGVRDAPDPTDVVVPTDLPLPIDVPLPTGPCRWRAGTPVVLPAANAPTSHRTLIDLRPAEGGAWALVADDAGADRAPDLSIERLDAAGSRRATVPLPGATTDEGSLAVNATTGQGAVLTNPRERSMGDCDLTLLGATAAPTATIALRYPRDGFALTGCHALAARPGGYSFLADQVRALNGVSLVLLDARGAVAPGAPALVTTVGQPEATRASQADGRFALLLRAATPGGDGRITAQAFDGAGESLDPPRAVQAGARPNREFVVTAAGEGFVAAWQEAGEGVPPQYGVAVRAIGPRGAPVGSARALTELGSSFAGLSATEARGDVLVSGVVATAGPRLVVVPLDAAGASRGEPVAVPTEGRQVERVRMVATPAGALLVYASDPGRYPSPLVAVPLGCGP